MSDDDWLKSNDLAGIRARLDFLGKKASKVAKQAEEISKEIEQIWFDLLEGPGGGEGNIKRSDGRLTEAGVKALNAAFDNGATVVQAAKAFFISPSAASTRRKIWLASKSSSLETKPTRPRKKISRTPPTDP